MTLTRRRLCADYRRRRRKQTRPRQQATAYSAAAALQAVAAALYAIPLQKPEEQKPAEPDASKDLTGILMKLAEM